MRFGEEIDQFLRLKRFDVEANPNLANAMAPSHQNL